MKKITVNRRSKWTGRLTTTRLSSVMKRFLTLLSCLLIPVELEASEALEQRVRSARQQRAAYQQALQERALQQRGQQMQQRQAHQQAVQQKAIVQRQNQLAYQKALQQKQSGELEAFQAYQQAVQHARQQKIQRLEQQSQPNLISPPDHYSNTVSDQWADPVLDYPQEPDEVVNMKDIWEVMEESSEVWLQMMDDEPKELTVARFIDAFRKKGIYIRKPAGHYVQMIDNMASKNANLLEQPFLNVLRIMAIIEYDYDNGQDKDLMARQVLGTKQAYMQNKQRLGR